MFGFSRKPIVAVPGTNSCNSASPLAPSSPANALKPVRLPPGRLRLATSPNCTGSLAIPNTIGMLVVAALTALWRPYGELAQRGNCLGGRYCEAWETLGCVHKRVATQIATQLSRIGWHGAASAGIAVRKNVDKSGLGGS